MIRRLLGLLVMMLLCVGCAFADTAYIHTGKGALNMRREASVKADIVKKIPDGAQVEVIMEENGWSRIAYQGKKGYVMSEFLRGETEVRSDAISSKNEQPVSEDTDKMVEEAALQQGGYAWIHTGSGKLNMRRKADAKSSVIAEVPDGERVEVERADEKWTRIAYKGKSGYVKTEYLQLDTMMIGRTVYSDEGPIYLLKEQNEGAASLASVHPSQGMKILELSRDWAKVAAYAEVYGDVQGYIELSAIAQLRDKPAEGAMEQMNAHLTIDKDTAALGDVMDFTLLGAGDAVCTLSLLCDGKTVLEPLPLAQQTFSYCPRESGAYVLEVAVSRPDGNSISCQARFTVLQQESPKQQGFMLYSQKDGTWLDVPYGRSNMDQSGCAIFALSHALALLGLGDGVNSTPQMLAQTYPMYLTDSGTVTSGLINAAHRDFGFSTKEEKLSRADKIVQAFDDGAVFSFSVASGHIALAAGLNEDGTKVRIIDSAPSATFERIENAQMYYLDETGAFQAAATLWDIPGARFYPETNQFGGLEYYLDLSYVARRGVRLIKPRN